MTGGAAGILGAMGTGAAIGAMGGGPVGAFVGGLVGGFVASGLAEAAWDQITGEG